MVYKTRRCMHDGCGKGGAYAFNRLCVFHWDMLIDKNIKKFIDAERKKGNLH